MPYKDPDRQKEYFQRYKKEQQRLQKLGLWPPPRATVDERFDAKVKKSEGCWDWIACLNGNGYGHFRAQGGAPLVLAHRWSYERHVGSIPKGLTLDHLCRNRACVNPAHLEPVTMCENNLRGESIMAQNARKTHCVRGHEFTPENTYINAKKTARRGGRESRECRACWKVRDAGRVRSR